MDLWRSVDQSGNDPAATEANARANGVAQRLTLVTDDITELSLPDASFDLVTSSLAIHNIHSADGRRVAVTEAWRCLAPRACYESRRSQWSMTATWTVAA